MICKKQIQLFVYTYYFCVNKRRLSFAEGVSSQKNQKVSNNQYFCFLLILFC
jgi:hypothetical protein